MYENSCMLHTSSVKNRFRSADFCHLPQRGRLGALPPYKLKTGPVNTKPTADFSAVAACQKTALARQRPRLPCAKGAVIFCPKQKMTEGLLQYNVPISPKINAYFSIFPRNPSAPSGHLPLHKGGFGAMRFYTFLLYNRLL